MRRRHGWTMVSLIGCLTCVGWSVTAAEPSFELTARYILDIVKAFRTAYVLQVVEHTREGGLLTREDWETDAHWLPLPAQFVKAAAGEVKSVEIGLVSLTPLNPANRPRTDAEANALIRLEQDRSRSFVSVMRLHSRGQGYEDHSQGIRAGRLHTGRYDSDAQDWSPEVLQHQLAAFLCRDRLKVSL